MHEKGIAEEGRKRNGRGGLRWSRGWNRKKEEGGGRRKCGTEEEELKRNGGEE